MTKMPTWAESLRRSHSMEAADGWQYGVVWRFARDTDYTNVELGPPPGDGWEVNEDFGDLGIQIRTPRWSDGSVVMHLTHWRREVAGMMCGFPDQTVHVRVAWDGDPKP